MSGSMGNRDMSYTNLANMVSNIENQQLRTIGAGASSSTGAGVVSLERQMTMRQQALELVSKATQLEKNLDFPSANQNYFQAAALYEQALAGADPGALTDEMQRELDQLHAHMQNLAADGGLISRSNSESAITSATPTSIAAAAEILSDGSVQKPTSSNESYSNFYDCSRPGELPFLLREAVQLTADVFHQMVRQFGFQYSSMRSQQEHLSMLLANSASHDGAGGDVPGKGLAALHKQLMSNYVAWARHLGTTPQCAGESDVAHNKAIDLALYLLIWGEAANLKHVPESLCFLFHKMRLELWRTTPANAPNRPQQWFLQYVINPFYKRMRSEMSRKSPAGKPLGHTVKSNYDDFNEFFWSADCLRYSYHDPSDVDLEPGGGGADASGLLHESFAGMLPGPPLSSMTPTKKFVERRHWLHPIRSFWRIHAFLLLMLHALLACAFNSTRTGIELDAALVASLCGVIVTHAGLGCFRETLHVFTQHGMLHIHLHVLGSLLLRLTLKVGFFATLLSSYLELLEQTPIGSLKAADPVAWIRGPLMHSTTFTYASAIYLGPVALSTLAQVFPFLSTWVRSWRGPMKALVDLFEPTNGIFVGKAIHTSFETKMPFDFFWVSLLCLKFWFSYSFQIAPLVKPTRDLWALDLSDWYPDADFGKLPNMVVLVVRWAPLMIMYMIDLQLWFMLWTAMYGTVIGCRLHIGEVPDLPTVRERFLSAAEAFNQRMLSRAVGLDHAKEKPYPAPRFSPAPAAASASGDGILQESSMEALRASLMSGATGTEESGEMALRNDSLRYFADAWNGILDDMRKSDLLSNHEQRLLVFRSWSGPLVPAGNAASADLNSSAGQFSRCTYLPVFCTAGKVNECFHLVRTLWAEAKGASPRRRLQLETQLHADISADFEMREAVTEFFELAVWLLAGLLGPKHANSITVLLRAVYSFVATGQVLSVLGASEPPALSQLSAAVVNLAKAALKVKPDAEVSAGDIGGIRGKLTDALDKLKACLNLRHAAKDVGKQLETIGFELSLFWDDAYARSTLASLTSVEGSGWAEKLTGIVTLCTTAQIDTLPEEFEVKRRLCWFVNSVFMDIPKPPPVAAMHSWTVMTPFYAEDLLYSAKELAAKTEDGVSTLIFLKTVHGNEWNNFLERIGVGKSREEEQRLFKEKPLLEELRLWASFRGQTLARTVEGMMLHEKALKLLGSWEGMRDGELHDTCLQKFQYLVAAQAYGNHKRSRDLKAADTEFLLQRYPSLRVAYVDKVTARDADAKGDARLKTTHRFYSVLIKGVKGDDDQAANEEIFRVQLPGDIMLGEGKPENQNQAIIFTRGEALQTIDMNQCGYFEEALKMRNLLCEFKAHPDRPQAPTIVGFREHIFTGTSKQLSSLASYMALQEGCFVTLTQRVLWDPLQVRLHYGHPDVFDKIFSMTRGGVSKASKGINLSEDIYAGFNHMLRGATIPYVEYVQVGKGRDVGMQQIYKFEAKLASGNAEQCISRDVYRCGQRLDFTRLLSFYYSGPGFYFNNACTVFAMFVFLYLQLWSHTLQLDVGVPAADLLNAQWVLQLGLLLTVPILCYLAVEHGITHSFTKFLETFVTGSPFFFMFHMGTKAHYYDGTLKYGGAKYRPTGRGFVMEHEEFAELYRFHAGSHLYNGFELLWGLLLMMSLGSWPLGLATYWRTCWSLWAVMISWLFAPFWFNPLAFDQAKLRQDVRGWLLWMRRKDASPMLSWEAWYEEEHSYTTTNSWNKKLHMFAPGVRYAFTFVGLVASISETTMEKGFVKELEKLGLVVGGVLAALLMLLMLRYMMVQSRSHLALRVGSTFLAIGAAICVPLVLSTISLYKILLVCAAVGYFCAALTRLPMCIGKPRWCIPLMQGYDYLCGGLLLGLCCLLSIPSCCRALQTKSLLSAVFERRVAHTEIMRMLDAAA